MITTIKYTKMDFQDTCSIHENNYLGRYEACKLREINSYLLNMLYLYINLNNI